LKTGVVSHIYVSENLQGEGAGKAMLRSLENWFREKEVNSIELQVVKGNYSAIKFWRENGYTHELEQYRKIL